MPENYIAMFNAPEEDEAKEIIKKADPLIEEIANAIKHGNKLDTKTSIQVMELLKKVAKDRLVVMVTHNPELAEEYATRIIKLKDGVGITATVRDIAENPKNITFQEVEAAQVPSVLSDVDYAVINSNYAIDAGLTPTVDGLGIENSASAYVNILVVREGNEDSDAAKALAAALESQQVYDFIIDNYDGGVVPVVEDRTDGYDDSVNYDDLAGTTISIAATPSPHAEILNSDAFNPEHTISLEDLTKYLKHSAKNPIKERMMTQFWALDNTPVETKQYWIDSREYLKK